MNNFKKIDFSSPEIQQRSIALGILFSLIIIIFLVIIMPLMSEAMELHNTKNDLVFKLQKYERILAKADLITKSVATINQQQDMQGYFNLQDTDALASADMQEFIKKAIIEAGGQLSSTQALPLSNKENFKRITVSVRMTGNSDVLRKVLYKIETSEPLIIINQIDIRPMRGTRNRVTKQMESSNELNVNFQAVSFMRKPA